MLAQGTHYTGTRYTYDPAANAVYLHFGEHDVMWTDELDPMTLVDCAADGTVVGVEIMHPNRAWPVQEIIAKYAHDSYTERQLRTGLLLAEQAARAA